VSEGLTIAQLSDIHCGSPHFVPSLLDRAIVEVNELHPDVVVVSGDLTGDGYRAEYELAREYLDKIACERMIVIPGNHDSRNVGYVHFEELFGERRSELHLSGVSILAVDSTEPDLDNGLIGRGRYEWI
jgi:3',5'-cyclic-AMP phosphodiesterase